MHRQFRYPIPINDYLDTHCVCMHLRQGDTAIDVGANVGDYTCFIAALVGSTGHVLAIEPEPKVRQQLIEKVRKDAFRHVNILPYVVSNQTQILPLYTSRRNPGDHRVWIDKGEERQSIPVESKKLDDLTKDLEEVHLLKIDTQGAEVEVLKGADLIIRRSPSIAIHIEYWPYGLEKMGSSSKELLHILEAYELQLYVIDTARQQLLRVCSESKIDLIDKRIHNPNSAETSPVINLWCVKKNWDVTKSARETDQDHPRCLYITWDDNPKVLLSR